MQLSVILRMSTRVGGIEKEAQLMSVFASNIKRI